MKQRIIEMGNYQNYECVGVFDGEKIIGTSGLWYSTRNYIGKSVEPDHVIADNEYRGKNIVKNSFSCIYQPQ